MTLKRGSNIIFTNFGDFPGERGIEIISTKYKVGNVTVLSCKYIGRPGDFGTEEKIEHYKKEKEKTEYLKYMEEILSPESFREAFYKYFSQK